MARLAGRRLLFAAPILLVVTFGVFASYVFFELSLLKVAARLGGRTAPSRSPERSRVARTLSSAMIAMVTVFAFGAPPQWSGLALKVSFSPLLQEASR